MNLIRTVNFRLDKSRILTRYERLAVRRLFEISEIDPPQLRDIRVVDMDDGGMGSLR
jgi:hypothetical protein